MSNGDVPIPRPRPERPEDQAAKADQLQNANQAASNMPASEAGAACADCPQGFKLEYKSRYTEAGQNDKTPNRYTKEVWVPAKEFIFLIGQDRKLTVRTNPPMADAEWEVKAVGNHSGTPKPNKGKGAEFSWVPQVTAAQRPTSASRSPNPPVKYEVTVKLTRGRSTTMTETIEQDPRDIIRQEYVDARMYRSGFTLHVPYRDWIITAPRAEFLNNNNYAQYKLVLDSGMVKLLEAVEAEYGETVTVNSSWRCPRRNLAAGSKVPNSNHQHGGAIDMAPSNYNGIRGAQAGRTAIMNLYRAALAAKEKTGARMVLLEKGPTALHSGNTDLPRPDAKNPDKNNDGIRDNDSSTMSKLSNASHVHIDKEPPGGGNDD
ncbi:D-Ala-D-Ala carboxypeptidase family metallohydrolase [Polyangium sp. y55x31]|uniref:D-Ala-D-Ala carboxypeptidase family metallohydrolase n=1 Tax=Polyangium sp. y55x31 TaxID=3042688 RepID=UPI0024830333|nr:D-Ala-D-Ala carboxypeptidase family metallohydrolase [Polyangium sp. y55x31]MDI1476782.1 D-Ala-D-Ala carboxypeptidase family metallohydrolase [Polyangium sp. y55x31]